MSCWTYGNKLKISFIFMIILSFALIIAKIIIGYKENSLSLVADSFHLILDVPALVIGFTALKFANEEVDDGKFTFGRIRAEILGAIINAIFLVAICFSLATESVKRLFVPHEIENPIQVLIIGVISLIVNAIGLVLFRFSDCSHMKEQKSSGQHLNHSVNIGSADVCLSALSEDKRTDSRKSKVVTAPNLLNIHGVFLHILQHAFIALIVITTALVVMYANGKWTLYIDPCLSLALVIFLLKSLFPLLQECLATLMQSVPADLRLENVEERLIKNVPEVSDVHELHIWQLGGHEVVGSAHIVFHSYKGYNQGAVNAIQKFFIKEGISSLTIQPEFYDFPNLDEEGFTDSKSEKCMLKCAEKKCAYLTCCETTSKIIAKLYHHQ